MKNHIALVVLFVAASIVLSSCNQTTTKPTIEQTEFLPEPTLPVILPTEELTIVPTLSYSATVYRDEQSGFEMDIPKDWTIGPSQPIGERGVQASFLSPGSTLEVTAEGGSRMFLTTYVWDPKNDLDAYIAQRKLAWEASGFTVLNEAEWQLSDGQRVVDFTVETAEKTQVLFSFTTAGEDYLQVSAEGNLDLCREIVHTLRMISD